MRRKDAAGFAGSFGISTGLSAVSAPSYLPKITENNLARLGSSNS
jgi:hypothetical protein